MFPLIGDADKKKKVKLSKTQSKLIQRMRNGDILHYLNGLNARCFFAKDKRNINWKTIFKLETMNLIKRGDKFIELTEFSKIVQL